MMKNLNKVVNRVQRVVNIKFIKFFKFLLMMEFIDNIKKLFILVCWKFLMGI